MSIIFSDTNLGVAVINKRNTPGIFTGADSAKDPANSVPYGTLYFAIDTGRIYQSNGSTWILSGVGGNQTWQQTLNQAGGKLLTANNEITNTQRTFSIVNDESGKTIPEYSKFQIDPDKLHLYHWKLFEGEYENGGQLLLQENGFQLSGYAQAHGILYDDNVIDLKIGYIGNDQTVGYSYLKTDGNDWELSAFANEQLYTLFYTNFRVDTLMYVIIGDKNNNIEGTLLKVDVTNSNIRSGFANQETGIDLSFISSTYRFGDLANTDETKGISFDILSGQGLAFLKVGTGSNREPNGLYIDFGEGSYQLGDFYGIGNNCWMGIDDVISTLVFSNALTVGSHGSVASTHLKVRIGGNNYVIQLRNA